MDRIRMQFRFQEMELIFMKTLLWICSIAIKSVTTTNLYYRRLSQVNKAAFISRIGSRGEEEGTVVCFQEVYL